MKIATVIGSGVLAALVTSPALSCSICRCGDPTFNALGNDGVARPGLRLALDWDQVKKTQGIEGEDFDSLKEERATVMLAYGVTDRISLFARIPFSQRDLTESEDGDTEHTSASGLADPELYAQVKLWSSAFEGDVGARTTLFGIAGVKTPWGQNDLSRNGERLDEHVQPGTGSTDWFAGLAGMYQINPQSALFVSGQYRWTGRNDVGYQYGDVSLFNLAYEHKLGTRWDAVLEANFRHAGRDEIDSGGATDADTGGSIVYLTPRVLFDVGSGWIVRGAVQIPLSQSHLYGNQEEKTVINFGVTHLFGGN